MLGCGCQFCHAALILQSSVPTPTAVAGGGGRFSPPFVCVSVFCTIFEKPMQLDGNLTQKMFLDESWTKLVYFRVKKSKVKVTSHKGSAGVSFCTLLTLRYPGFLPSSDVQGVVKITPGVSRVLWSLGRKFPKTLTTLQL